MVRFCRATSWAVLSVTALVSRGVAGAEEALSAEDGFVSEAHIVKQAKFDECQAEATRLAAKVVELEDKIAGWKAAMGAGSDELLEKPGTKEWWRHASAAFGCVVLAALAAGLTMGLVSIEPMEMKIIVNTEDKDMIAEKDKIKLKDDQAAARRVLPLIQDHHRLLVTLLLMNSIANEALPLFLDKLVPSWLAVLLSVTLVLIFGEIIPSAVFTGSEQLRIASMFAPLVGVFRFILTPIAMPIAKVLDFLLGEDHKGRYNFAELRAIVGIHANLRTEEPSCAIFKGHDDKQLGIITTERPHGFSDESVVCFTDAPGHPARSSKLDRQSTFYYALPCEPLVGRDPTCTFKLYTHERRERSDLVTFEKGDLESGAFMSQERDEIKIMHGVMKLTHMSAKDGIKPLSQVDMIQSSAELTRDKLTEILEWGHSRIPVFSNNMHNVRGFILTKKLIVVSPDEGRQVSDLALQPLVLVPPHIPMLDLLNKFQADRCHIALVSSDPDKVRRCWDEQTVVPPDVHMMGIITLEDIIEKLIQEEIYDEHDSKSHEGSPRRTASRVTASPAPRPAKPRAGSAPDRKFFQKGDVGVTLSVPSPQPSVSKREDAPADGGSLMQPLLPSEGP